MYLNLGLMKRRGITIPRDGLLFLGKDGLTDSIGLSASDYLSVSVELQSIFFADETTLNDFATIISNIEASEYLNVDYLVGTSTKGYALYADGTSGLILIRAYRYFGLSYVPVNAVFPYTLPFTLE